MIVTIQINELELKQTETKPIFCF